MHQYHCAALLQLRRAKEAVAVAKAQSALVVAGSPQQQPIVSGDMLSACHLLYGCNSTLLAALAATVSSSAAAASSSAAVAAAAASSSSAVVAAIGASVPNAPSQRLQQEMQLTALVHQANQCAVLLANGGTAEAKQQLVQCLRALPEYSAAVQSLLFLYLKTGSSAEALQLLQTLGRRL